jgi:2Fe-2S ferredoxin
LSELIVTTREGMLSRVECEAGISVLEAIRNAGIDEILAICGGACCCATCHVHVDEEFAALLPAISENERELLGTFENRLPTSRLACQLVVDHSTDGMRVTIAPEE